MLTDLTSYPAGHVRIHQLLYTLTESGRDIRFAQKIYAALYTATLALACAIYWEAGGFPNWVLLLLPLSKRLHSIFVLRLFNDCWAVLAMQAAILMYQNGLDDTATILYRYVTEGSSLMEPRELRSYLVPRCLSRCPSFYIFQEYSSSSSSAEVFSPRAAISRQL